MLRLYGRGACHLCDVMADALRRLGVAFEKVDVDQRPELALRYGDRVPVLADADGREVCHGRLDTAALHARLALE
jgi:glutaredoxin